MLGRGREGSGGAVGDIEKGGATKARRETAREEAGEERLSYFERHKRACYLLPFSPKVENVPADGRRRRSSEQPNCFRPTHAADERRPPV